ncbi:MAG TPA: glycoside hydrolase family 15 protein [Rhizomicrobium sp.]|jgi:GH15 family glucan-1,4-alpha-glucosidase|nr:glycoside hydrolase family 15 protein [Rhizomicrobium sp.]
MPGRIEDYAIIGDMRTAALIGRDGCIDWLCLPRFDSAACFAALLGDSRHGRWQIVPQDDKYKVKRRYRDGTLILETRFKTSKGEAVLVDFMPVGTDHSCIVRLVMGLSGYVEFETELVIRFDYGITVPWVARISERALSAVAGPNLLTLHTFAPLYGEDMRTKGKFAVRAGETVPFVLMHSPSHLPVPFLPSVETMLAETEKYWTDWSNRAVLNGRWEADIRRSLITLKALSYRPTGGIVAAVTTSLPEQIGGARNWDYRFCWLRDATFTLLAFMNAGYTEEAVAWVNWLIRAIAGSPEQIQTLYGVAGERRLDEWKIDWLPGYENSAPVRIGNAAALQLQLDIYGELADVVVQARKGGLPLPARRIELRRVVLGHLEEMWRSPDEGIWEIRGEPQHFVHSKVMAWVAFDRASENAEEDKENAERWKRDAKMIRREILRKGIDPERNCFVQAYGSKHLDASLLLLPIVGFISVKDPRMKNTIREIERHLMFDGLVLRYETGSGVDGLAAGEGAFLACSFWLIDNYLLQGRRRDAERLYDRLLGLANDVGLLAEEYDPRGRRMLGNFPQAFSHVALVNSGLNLLHAGGPAKRRRARHPRRHVARDKA